MRLALAFMLLTTMATAPLAAHAAEVRTASGVSTDRPATPPRGPVPLPGDRSGGARRDHDRTTIIIPPLVLVSPGRCWQSGYWTYQWVPQSYSYSAWVDGQWSADGYWIPSHYEPVYYSGGYYQPLWIDGYWMGC
jgi:hypothetical protein